MKSIFALIFLVFCLAGNSLMAQNPFLTWSGGLGPCDQITITYSCIGAVGTHDHVVASNIPGAVGEEAGDYLYYPTSLSSQIFWVTSSTGGTATITISPSVGIYIYIPNDTVFIGAPVVIYWGGSFGTNYTIYNWGTGGSYATSGIDTLYPQMTTTFCVTAHFSCGDTTICKTVAVQKPLFLQQDTTKNLVEEGEGKITIYPNPSKDAFAVKGNYLKVKIFNSLGQLLLEEERTGNSHDISRFPSGLYNVFVTKTNWEVATFLLEKIN